MQALFKVQQDVEVRIRNAKMNYSKSPKDRINQQYIEARLGILEALWSKFLTTHDIKGTKKDDLKDIEYDNLYDNVKECYVEYKCKLTTDLAKYNVEKNDQNSSKNNEAELKGLLVQLPKITIFPFSVK
ncbi:unnamed protein product [Parnassius apollo]|uniref:(apollo) hypothetical protein n=1 Tax=Parnassius apollo TaxID=110799 RepID=A0A8S3Y3T4_PARAO|nr:unnamed protein product [Parnassius apollo]